FEPYYHQVEEFIGMAGDGGANPFASPRKHDYPMPPLRRSGWNDLMELGARKAGYHPFPCPAMMNSEPYNGRPACTYCGFCTGYGCWNASKSSMDVTAVPAALETGKLEIRTNSRVTEILSN